MKQLIPTTEDAMIAAFLEAELDSKRHAGRYNHALKELGYENVPTGFLQRAEYTDARRRLLKEVRGWPDRELFQDFPECSWQRGILEDADLTTLDYIHYSYWDELSHGSHHVVDGAASVAKNEIVFEQPNTAFWEVERLTKEGAIFPALIVLKNRDSDRLTLVEGHVRATGFALAGKVPHNQPVIVGTAIHENQSSKEQKL